MRVDWAYAMAVRTNRVAQDRPECRIAPSAESPRAQVKQFVSAG